ncbi:MAG: twin-arginine translocase subunit TatC [Bacteroidales bacterium]|nr:twin-arginine translocase subunit TatC [Bacteroidales bacterium]MCF8402665.1 twin-arginine translocase subunit TatC [Bacteroidales bacterium]
MQEKISNKKNNAPVEEENEMSFWEHLEELRAHLFRSIAAIMVFSIAAFLAKRIVFDVIILAPKSADFITNRLLCKASDWLSIDALCIGRLNLSMQNINMSGQFMTHMYVSLIAGVIVAAPYIIWEMWRFIMPALKPKEKKYSRGAVFVSSLLFFSGVLFAYFLIVPLTINFLGTYQVSPDVPNQIHLNSYISTVVSVTIAVGIVFELPILVFFLTKVGIVTPAFLKKNRKIMFIIVLVLSAIITPPDVFSQILVCIPLIGLYELSIKISEKVYKQKEAELAG